MTDYGKNVVEERAVQIQQQREQFAVDALEKGYKRFADSEYSEAFLFGLVSWGNLNKGQAEAYHRVAVDNDLPEQEGFWMLYMCQWEVRTLTDKRYLDLSNVALEAASRAIREPIGDRLIRVAYGYPRSPPREVSRAVARHCAREVLAAVERVCVGCGLLDDGEDVYTLGEDFEESPLHDLAKRRRRQDRDLKVIIVARDSQTGTGKTTLAVQLCQKWSDDWTADWAANTASEYMRVFEGAPKESVILADEIGTMFDNRRSMSGDNVDASQMWDIMRKWEKWTIATLPGASSLDKRFLQKADVLIVVRERGIGRVMKLKETDVEGDLYTQGMCTVRWGAIDDDREYQEVEAMKDELMEKKISQFLGGGDDQTEDGDDRPSEKEIRNKFIRRLVDGGFTQIEVADAIGLSQSAVSRIVSS